LDEQDAEKVRQRKKTVIWFVWFLSFVWLNETNQMNQINQMNKTNQFEHPAGHCFRGKLERLRRQERCEYFRRLRGDFGK
jgi:hypothetical protein